MLINKFGAGKALCMYALTQQNKQGNLLTSKPWLSQTEAEIALLCKEIQQQVVTRTPADIFLP